MKNVLIICYHFPPDASIGSLRMKGLAKYLPEYGWNPVILTKKVPRDSEIKCKIVNTPHAEHDSVSYFKQKIGLNKDRNFKEQFHMTVNKNKNDYLDLVFKSIGSIIAYPDAQRGWYKYAFNAGLDILKTESIDAIVSSSGPFTCHLIAHDLKEKTGIPWIADMRDLWVQNQYYQYLAIRKFIETKLEIKTLKTSDCITSVSDEAINILSEIHGVERIIAITNGYDPDQLSASDNKLTNKFSITYTGSLRGGKKDPSKLFKALSELILEKRIDPDKIKVRFYGPYEGWLQNEVLSYGLENIVELNGFVLRDISFEKQRESHLLLLLLWDNSLESKWMIPAKIFEYIAAKRPILAIGGFSKGDAYKLLKNTKAGIYASSIEEVKSAILEYYTYYSLNGTTLYAADLEAIESYSQREMARKFAQELDIISHKD